ncbi:DUF5687 family protein [Labilibaculum sp. K2S]|uniref:DUF5687 family protein n=1 Tax=Labilibaculum sp. K2S TaxID=3056386 RepID=UPI0025A4C0C4|nr:DUF5687 family protein [Labilibaculum sp. K2S]MDM8158539.1 DUF5687 family protein [Labilibaculum sp. K2S]
MFKLLLHQWKEAQRSTFWQKSIALNILLVIIGLYLLLNVIALGYFADEILQKTYKDSNVIDSYNRILFYFFSFDLIVRFLFQPLPILSIQAYLSLPIKKSTLLHYPLVKSVFNFMNLLGFLLVLPFFLKVICHTQSPLYCFTWFLVVIAFIAANNFLTFFLKKYFTKKPALIFLILGFVAVLVYCDIANLISISDSFSEMFSFLNLHPVLLVVPIAMATASYSIAYHLLKRNSYIEDIISRQTRRIGSFSFLNRYGEIGDLIGIELKMTLRNKRPRSLMMLGAVFLLYGFLFYKEESLNDYYILIIAGVLLTAAAAFNHAQLMFAWNSSFFDSFLVNKISLKNYIKSKFLFFAVICIACYFITLPYAFISYKIALINTAVLFYNIGITFFLLAYASSFSTSRIDMGKGTFMNYEGMGISQFLIIIPLFALPSLFQLLFSSIGYPQYGIYALGITGLIAIACNKFLIQIILTQLVKRKYKMAVGFRQK